jgi:WD40 repeat protein
MNECEVSVRNEQSKRQTKVEIYEIGTGIMTFSLNQDFLITQAKWSTNGNYLAVTSCNNKQLRVFQVDQMTQENVWTLKD